MFQQSGLIHECGATRNAFEFLDRIQDGYEPACEQKRPVQHSDRLEVALERELAGKNCNDRMYSDHIRMRDVCIIEASFSFCH